MRSAIATLSRRGVPARLAAGALGLAMVACSRATSGDTDPAPPPMTTVPTQVDTVRVTVADPEQQRRIGELELRLLERDAQIERLETSLEESRREVVRSLARLQTTASRAEAASALAEADIAIQTLRNRDAQAPELGSARRLLQLSTAEFDKQNYGGALYLANEVKKVIASGRGRLAETPSGAPRPGETPFAVAVPLVATTRSNVRDGPGTNYRIVFTVDRGTVLTGLSRAQDWVRVTDDSGRSGWVFYNLVARRGGG